ncbi:MAG: ABC transporter permease [Dongiaceae bacterium]
MRAIALKMLLGDSAKYLGLISGIAFAAFLMSQQVSIFIGLMARTASEILDVVEADVWVMDPRVQYVEEIEALREVELTNVRSVPGVAWAVPLYKGLAVVRTVDGVMQQASLLGVDDASLIGSCAEMLHGRRQDLLRPEALMMDRAGYEFIWPGEPVRLPREIEINDHRMQVVALCEARAPFTTFPKVYMRYSEALRIQPPQRKRLAYVLAKAAPGQDPAAVAANIAAATGLQAMPWHVFMWRTIDYYLARTGIPVNFGITVILGFVIGAAIAGQTFFIFVLENIRQFGALKAIGVTNGQVLAMVLTQAAVVGAIGYSIGIGFSTIFFETTGQLTALRGFFLPWQVVAGVGAAVFLIMVIASLASVRKVFVLDPAIVFRG